MSKYLDSDFHGLAIAERSISRPEWAAPVVVGDNVFIGANVRILKGVRIGAGAVIGNSSVVVSDIPPAVVAAGVPAKIIRSIT
ncbi:DapH/DapD/GlmU-related protein [Thermosynechococcus vestitus]|uniref:DapH/DapD/GlmU-related protein n=1 Tax=Thermosynechococcus vestitus TaxID=146786 RepID=UPI0002F67B67|nr:maltose O-acetyltransferase like protein [Thermostichus vulcanus NIES-2134]